MRKSLLIGGLTAIVLMTAAATTSVADSYAEDRAQIEDLMGRYLFALDWQDADTYASTFTEDGVLDWARGAEKGRAAIRAAIAQMREASAATAAKSPGKRPPRRRHNITNTVIKVDGNKAKSVSYWTAYYNNNDKREAQVEAYGHYEDELVKQNGHWLFTKRKIFNEEMDSRAASDKSPAW
jgi:3-phenylpropionate/cinnamic acid dioxygenase small subunit